MSSFSPQHFCTQYEPFLTSHFLICILLPFPRHLPCYNHHLALVLFSVYTKSLTQGKGALVWASEEWQSLNPSIVAVPTYPETILDDHSGYTTTEYVELTKRFIDYLSGEYAVDTDRIYGTGQSMGCMTTLILASEYPDLYAACMFVDGQWDVSALKGLKDQTFVYFAAEDDTNAWNGFSSNRKK